MTRVAFVGLGNMGLPMAINLLRGAAEQNIPSFPRRRESTTTVDPRLRGDDDGINLSATSLSAEYDVTGVDLSPVALQAFQEAGGKTTDNASEAARQADLIISMLPAGRHVQDLYLGDGSKSSPGLLAQLGSHAMIIDCSTIEADVAKSVGKAAAARGVAFVDAPVSGGTAGAAAGTLTFMVGGEAAAVERATPALNVMGQAIFHAGDVGAGQLAKICNNMLLAVLMTGTAEALKLGMDNGLDPAVLSEIMKNSSGGNWVLNKYNPVPGIMANTPASDEYQGGFMTALMMKDLGLALSAAQGSGSATPMGALAENLYRMHAAKNGSEQDFSSVIKLYEADS